MTKIFVVAPYQSFIEMFAEVFANHEEDVYRDGETPDEYVLEMVMEHDQEKIARMRPVCDVVIARSFSALLLNRCQDVPVVAMPVLPYDIIRCINKGRGLYGKRRIVLPATVDMTRHVKELSNLLDLDIQTIDMPSNMGREPEIAFAKIDDPESIVIGGKATCDLAAELGYPSLVIESGPEAMSAALSEAKRLARVRRLEREKAQSFKAILDCNADGILGLDRRHNITSMNSMAEKILGLNAGEAIGKNASDLFPESKFRAVLANPGDIADEVARLGGVPLAVNKTGIFLGGQRIGSVVTLQYVTKIQNSEKNLRGKIMERGLVARHAFGDIYGKAASIRMAVRTARKYSHVDSSVLIIGENGTGKELLAQSIHNAGRLKNRPFVAINCAAIPDTLLESELFGYVEGAFTGASRGGKPGLIELAHQGTLFLDEIGEMPLRLQGRLLRVLQEKEFMRLGSDKVTPVDIRVISATNKDLFELIEARKFREDLYYRLAVLTVALPSLDERREDIPGLVGLFLDKFAARLGRPTLTLTAGAMELLCGLDWRGNIRELQNACEQLTVLSEKDTVELEDVRVILAGKIAQSARRTAHNPETAANGVTRERVEKLLREGYSKQSIADRFGVNRTTLWRKMRMWGMLQK